MSTPTLSQLRDHFLSKINEQLKPWKHQPLDEATRERLRAEALAAREENWPVGEERGGYCVVSRTPCTSADDIPGEIVIANEVISGPPLEAIRVTFNVGKATP